MPTPAETNSLDKELSRVEEAIAAIARRLRTNHETLFGRLIRQALDEVIDGPRTGRWTLDQLSKTEKTYVGTKVEILVRSDLALEAGVGIDTVVDGVGVDIKWSQSLGWMIGQENVEAICLGLGLASSQKQFSVGLFRARREFLRQGANRDQKLSLTAAAMEDAVIWLVKDAILPVNFIAELDPEVRSQIFDGKSAQERLRMLAELVPRRLIPRHAIETVAMTKDPLRRTRRDAGREHPLGDMVLLSTKYGRPQLIRLGFTALPADHWVSVRLADLLA